MDFTGDTRSYDTIINPHMTRKSSTEKHRSGDPLKVRSLYHFKLCSDFYTNVCFWTLLVKSMSIFAFQDRKLILSIQSLFNFFFSLVNIWNILIHYKDIQENILSFHLYFSCSLAYEAYDSPFFMLLNLFGLLFSF